MKKIFFLMAALLMVHVAFAENETKVVPEDDIGYCVNCGSTTFATENYLIEGVEAPAMLNMEVSEIADRVVDVILCPITIGDNSMTHVCFLWPYCDFDNISNSTLPQGDVGRCKYHSSFPFALTESI